MSGILTPDSGECRINGKTPWQERIAHVKKIGVVFGQRMRCEIAASLLHSPKILFLDEPTIGLDAVSKIAVASLLKL